MTPSMSSSVRHPHIPFAWILLPVLALLPLVDLRAQVPDSARVDSFMVARPDTSMREQDIRSGGYTIGAADLDAEVGGQDVSGILQSSRDVFNATAGFTLGAARFRIRGFDGENTLVTLHGVLVNDLETGYAPFTWWGGLNDVTRWTETRTGVSPSRYNFGGIGGYSEINLRASDLRKGTRISYALSNRTYVHRAMATYNTGLMKNGWAFSISGSRRWSNEGYVPGTFYDAGAYFVSAEKKINERHAIGFVGLGAPIIQGRQGLAVQEAYDLTGSNYYNPLWGWQDGEKRNARVSNDHKPLFLLTHYWTPDARTRWNTSVLYTFGRDGMTNLNWYDAKDPRPDYYRYLPSYNTVFNPTLAGQQEHAWRTDGSVSQINWDQLYFANGKNLFTVLDAEGIAGNNITGNRSKYIVEDQRSDPTRLSINTAREKELANGAYLTLGASYNQEKTHNFKVMEDLLGGDFWVDLDQFADRDSNDPNAAQNNLQNPNHVVREGDAFGYDWDMHVRMVNAFGQLEKKWARWEGYIGASISQTTFWRDSRFRKAIFADNSFGESEKHDFVHGGVKAGGVYKITGRHFITANAAFLSRPPAPRYAFLSPNTRHTTIDGLTSEKALSGDISYQVRMPRVRGRATLYYAHISDQVWTRRFYHDDFLTFINYSMTGVAQEHIGAELGAEVKLTPTWQATFVYALGRYLYDSRPKATITRDNADTALASGRTVYWENYRVGGMPQSAGSVGLRYNDPHYWSIGANLNFFNDIYLDPNPDRRTAEALDGLITDDPQWDRLLQQTKLDNGVTLDLFAMKSWRFKNKYRLAVNVSVSNVLDTQDFNTGGYEQLRYAPMEIDKFPPKLSYMYGRTYFAMVTLSF